MNNQKYCNSLTQYSRLQSREVMVGKVGIGGKNPIRIQSMTTTDTMDTKATVSQTIRMIESGCEIVRITAPSIKEAKNLQNIKDELHNRGYDIPLVADIHFTPNAAEIAATIVEKVRINPGNYADKKKFETIDYTDDSYISELERIRARFVPLIKICKEHGTAMRIGTNHGSLSDRILSRYGDTPLGMVESALEFLRICEDEHYHEIVLSMKSSNTQVMVQAYRLLINRMQHEGMNYPLHLGVTEAGEGEDGRIKSAVGIGTLLEDGLGDTIRVSLTEEPEFEAPVALALANRYKERIGIDSIPPIINYPINPFEYQKNLTQVIGNVGGENVPRVIADFSQKETITPASLYAVGYNYNVVDDKWGITDLACDYLFTANISVGFNIPGTLGIIHHYKTWLKEKSKDRRYPLFTVSQYLQKNEKHRELNFVRACFNELSENLIATLKHDSNTVLIIATSIEYGMMEQRKMFVDLIHHHCNIPVIISRTYRGLAVETLQLHAATDIGALLIDGLGDGILISTENSGSDQQVNQTSFGILQATRTRNSKTEYISCPSCGRTLFDLQETTAKIRSKTDHLKGLKIGIMGCIVNGPGEMADADYGYVGVGKGKISLYKGHSVVKKGIEAESAVDELIKLIKENGDWIEQPVN